MGSSEIFPPTVLGLSIAWSNTKVPMFRTQIADSEAGTEARISLRTFPRFKYTWSFPVLADDPAGSDIYNEILGFFLARRGRFESFLIRDTDESVDAVDIVVGVGDSVATDFQLVRRIGPFTEIVKAIGDAGDISGFTPTTLSMKLDATTKTYGVDYTYQGAGLVRFTTPPGSGVLVKASFRQYHRVRFVEDEAEYEQFMIKLWRQGTVELVSVVGEEGL